MDRRRPTRQAARSNKQSEQPGDLLGKRYCTIDPDIGILPSNRNIGRNAPERARVEQPLKPIVRNRVPLVLSPLSVLGRGLIASRVTNTNIAVGRGPGGRKQVRDTAVDKNTWVLDEFGNIECRLGRVDIKLLRCEYEIARAELVARDLFDAVVVPEQTVVRGDRERPAGACLDPQQAVVLAGGIPDCFLDWLERGVVFGIKRVGLPACRATRSLLEFAVPGHGAVQALPKRREAEKPHLAVGIDRDQPRVRPNTPAALVGEILFTEVQQSIHQQHHTVLVAVALPGREIVGIQRVGVLDSEAVRILDIGRDKLDLVD